MSAISVQPETNREERVEAASYRISVVDVRLILVLFVIAAGLRIWHLATTEVTSRDSIHYMRMAWEMGHGRAISAIRNGEQHPGFPMALCAVQAGIGLMSSAPFPEQYQWAAQWTSIGASLLAVPVLYALSRQLFSPMGAFFGVLFIQILPATGRLLADGLSESLFLLLVMTSVLSGFVALRGFRSFAFALCGLTGGLAYLVRPEGAIFPLSVGIVLLFRHIVVLKQPWVKFAGVLAVSFLAVALPFVIVVGKLTSKPTAIRVLTADEVRAPIAAGSPILASWFSSSSNGMDREVWAVWVLLGMVARGTLFVLWIPALAGLICYRKTIWNEPGAVAYTLGCVILALLLERVAATMGYLSDRHMVVLICAIAILAGGFIQRFAALLPAWWKYAALLAMVVPVLATGTYRTLEPLHANRAGFRQAGDWLANNVAPGDEIDDPFCWSHFYAGRVFQETVVAGLPVTYPRRKYVVTERSSSKHERLGLRDEADLVRSGGTVVFTFQPKRRKAGDAVVVYAVPVGP
jgi:Dolichyl-phosphate-mannose-protein mannosyltransferase